MCSLQKVRNLAFLRRDTFMSVSALGASLTPAEKTTAAQEPPGLTKIRLNAQSCPLELFV